VCVFVHTCTCSNTHAHTHTHTDSLLTKEETILQDKIDRLIDIGKFCGLEKYVAKTKVIRILRPPPLVQIMVDQKQLETGIYQLFESHEKR
jgi:hypothetical protein